MATRKKSTTKKAATRKPKEKQTQYADGKDDRKNIAKTIESLLEVRSRDPFRVTSGENFEEVVTSMSLTDMQEIAVQAGVFPSGTKATLRNKLIKEYQNRVQGIYGAPGGTKPIVDPGSERAKKLLKLLNE
jgi:hypothetical protein